MRKRIPYHRIVFILYILALVSFLFLNCQEITRKKIAAIVTVMVIPFLGRIVNSKATYKKEVIVFLLYMILEICISKQRYGQSIVAILYYIIDIFSMILYLYFVSFSGDFNWYISTFKRCGKVVLFLLYFAVIAYYVGFRFLDSTIYRARGNNLRLTVGMMIMAFYIVFLFSDILKQGTVKNSLGSIILIMLSIIYLVFICQTRMHIIGVFTTIAFMMIFCIKNPSKKIIIFSIGILAIVCALQFPVVQNYIGDNFGGVFDGTDDAMIPRMGAIPHYIEMAKEHKLLGVGIIDAAGKSNGKYDLFYIMHGKWGVYSYDDVGIFSYYMMYGLVGLCMYVYLVIRLFIRAWKERYIMPYKMGMVIYVIITGFSMIITDLWHQSNIALFLLLMDINIEKSREVKKV